jgi:hypothetical protein
MLLLLSLVQLPWHRRQEVDCVTPARPLAAGTPGTPGAELNGNGHTPFHPSVQAFKAAALDIVREYFDSGALHAAPESTAAGGGG